MNDLSGSMRMPLDDLHYGTPCPELGHDSDKVRISLAIDLRHVRIAVTPFLFYNRAHSNRRAGRKP